MKVWNEKIIAARIEEAFDTLKRLPSERIHTYKRLWSNINFVPTSFSRHSYSFIPPVEAIKRMEETFEWIAVLNGKDQKILYLKALKIRSKIICNEMHIERSTVWRQWRKALSVITCMLTQKETLLSGRG